MKTKLFILLLFVASCRTTSEPKSSIQSSQPSAIGAYDSPDFEYQLYIPTADSAYLYVKFDSYGESASSVRTSNDSIFLVFDGPNFVLCYYLKVYPDSLSGTQTNNGGNQFPVLLNKVQ